MKHYLRRFLFLSAVIWLFCGIVPVFAQMLLPGKSPEPPAQPVQDAQQNRPSGIFRIWDEATEKLLTVTEDEFLPLALLCEMSPDAPEEALKAQACAIFSACSYLREHSSGDTADFSCNTALRHTYAPKESFEALYGDDWPMVSETVSSLCAEVKGQCLYYEEEIAFTPYFAISAGCTQPGTALQPEEDFPYLRATACPEDLLNDRCRTVCSFTPDEVLAAFPGAGLSALPPECWFSEPVSFSTGYIEAVLVGGTSVSGQDIREALSLGSSAFTVTYAGGYFVFTVTGMGHGVGMSQSAAIYMAQHGADHREILTRFYPGTELGSAFLGKDIEEPHIKV